MNRQWLLLLLVWIGDQQQHCWAFHGRISRPWDQSPSNNCLTRKEAEDTALVFVYPSQVIQMWRQTHARLYSTSSSTTSSTSEEEEPSTCSQPSNVTTTGSVESSPSMLDPLLEICVEKSTVAMIWDHLPELWRLTRPWNLPGVVLLHFLGSYLAVVGTTTANGFQAVLTSRSMWMVLTSLVLTSCTSMLVNDYYDVKLGRDVNSTNTAMPPLPVIRSFLNGLYFCALLLVTCLPGVITRLSVMMGLISTFWYTKHIKPMTWWKNIVCAGLIALAPWTSAVATLALEDKQLMILPDLWRLVGMLFLGVLGREILMDITDVQEDSKAQVCTIPVKYGVQQASWIALLCSGGSALCALVGPLQSVFSASMTTYRRLIFASLGSLVLGIKNWQVYASQGDNQESVVSAIEAGQLTLVLLLLSFI